MAFFADEPPVLLDWMPWNHVAGGSHNTGIAIYNGGTFYIDDGEPTPGRFEPTLRNLKDVQPTYFTNVPKAYEFLVGRAARSDRGAAAQFLRAAEAACNMPGRACRSTSSTGSTATAEPKLGERVMIITGYGSTETAPFAFTTTWPVEAGRPYRPAGAGDDGQARAQ